jgi:aryl-phospho-beta-D-glucosidase BglC (GH1 family)
MNASAQVVNLSGLSWFGFETSNQAPYGLDVRKWEDLLDQTKQLGYNVIRLPFSNAMLKQGTKPAHINYTLNPDLAGLSSLEVMDRIIAGAGKRGIRVILDNHRSTAGDGPESNGLWYTSEYPEKRWIDDWKMLATRYNDNPAIIGADLRNEPFSGCWGCGDAGNDWRLAAEKAGNAILSVNPDILIIVQGVSEHNGQSTFWGGNLTGVKNNPIRLTLPDRLVYSVHEYPESVSPQPWFNDQNYPQNLPGIWDQHWGYLIKEEIAPVLVGEFGTRYETDKDKQWLQAFQEYIKKNKLDWIYWSLNPNSKDTGGLILDDWTNADGEKQAILAQIQYPFIEFTQPGSKP